MDAPKRDDLEALAWQLAVESELMSALRRTTESIAKEFKDTLTKSDAIVRMTEHARIVAEKENAMIACAASLAAAISLLERGGKAAKKAAPSDKMFDQMLLGYKTALELARAALKGDDNG